MLLAVVILLMQRGRKRWDDDRDFTARVLSSKPFASIVTVWHIVPLRRVGMAGNSDR